MLKFLLVLVLLLQNGSMFRLDNICSTKHVKRIFIGLGESGILTAYNISTSYGNVTLNESCQVEIVTCPSCAISVTFHYMNLSCYCGPGFNLALYNPCRCDFVWIIEPPYNEVSSVSFCNVISDGINKNRVTFKSKTRIVRITFVYTIPHHHAFTLGYISEPNRWEFYGVSRSIPGLNLTSGIISSPFFPMPHPRDLSVEYSLTCRTQSNYFLKHGGKAAGNSSCSVHVIFSDFQIGTTSQMEFYDGTRLITAINGSVFRPPVIITSTNSLTVRFYANGESNLGFKAAFSFVSEEDVKKMMQPVTDCGGCVENLGGTITMMKMVKTEMKLYDCIWLIRPWRNVLELRTHLYLKVTTFLDFEGNPELEIRKGLTSESPLLDVLKDSLTTNFKEHVHPLKYGYYVSLKAFFRPTSYLAITYAPFSYHKCYVMSDFFCRNHRCISKKLTCDGFDHCGDNSDEPETCYNGWRVEPAVGRWYTQSSNYYFPKLKTDTSWSVPNILLCISLVGFVLASSAFTLFLYRMGSRRHHERNLHEQLQSISELLDGFSDEVFVEEVIIDNPPCYEPPPNYDEVIKSSKFNNLGLGCGTKTIQENEVDKNLKDFLAKGDEIQNGDKDASWRLSLSPDFCLRSLFSTKISDEEAVSSHFVRKTSGNNSADGTSANSV